MYSEDIDIRAQWSNWYGYIEIMARETDRGYEAFAKPVVFEERDSDAGFAIEPMLKLSKQSVQRLMDDLWQCGIRPSEQVGSVGQLKATEKHLEDMRTLVFKKDGE